MVTTVLFAQMFGALLGSYLILRLVMYVCRKVRRMPNGALEIAGMGLLTLVIVTVIGGYGMKDGKPEPVFVLAFFRYFGPVMAVTVIELVRLYHRNRRP